MKVVIGLGNPGDKYILTRHNIGFLYLDWLKFKLNIQQDFTPKSKLKCLTLETEINNQKVILAKPQTYMNLSGEAFQAIQNYYKLEHADFLVIYDDVDLEFNNFRYREKGSAGTHNGMKSIIQHTNTQEVPRLRLGVSNAIREHQPLADFVLSNFSKQEQQELSEFFESTSETLQKLHIL